MVSVKTFSRAGFGFLLNALVLICAPVVHATDAQTMGKTISVVIDQAHLVDLPAGTSTLIIGNPTIADVTMIGAKGSLMILTPKAFGETFGVLPESRPQAGCLRDPTPGISTPAPTAGGVPRLRTLLAN